jgi:hypothetical protein
MMRRANVLSLSILVFLYFSHAYVHMLISLNQRQFEETTFIQVDTFSYWESLVLQKTIEAFRNERLTNFTLQSKLGQVVVVFDDEIAWIRFDSTPVRYARMDYDLVFDSCMSYRYIEASLFPTVDKAHD